MIGKEVGSRSYELEFKIDNQKTERVNEIKYLGFEIEEKLDLNAKINTLTNKLASKINVIYRDSD